jgi:hypothetical protein
VLSTELTAHELSSRRRLLLIGGILLAAALLGHLLAAQAIGGSFVAYRDHIGGFLVLTLASGLLALGLSRLFWRGRPEITVLGVGAVQAMIGVYVYIERFSVHG